MDTKDPVVVKTELIIDALMYAHEHNLDIKNRDDVKKITEALNVQEDVDEFMKLLQGADSLIENDADRRSKIN